MGNHHALLTDAEKERYHRQMIFPGWGEAGQQKIKQATVFIAGVGGLGSPVAIYLAVAGIGCLRICDSGEPELSNLNRQILHTADDIGKKKVASAKTTLSKMNPHVEVVSLPVKITRENIAQLVADSQIIIDCLDNFEIRTSLDPCWCLGDVRAAYLYSFTSNPLFAMYFPSSAPIRNLSCCWCSFWCHRFLRSSGSTEVSS